MERAPSLTTVAWKFKAGGKLISGIARYFGFDSTLARVGYVILSVISVAFPGILVYIILWFILPADE